MLDYIKQPITFRRIIFMGMGGFIIVSSITKFEWVGVIIGIYFFAMGLFNLGCANNCSVSMKQQKSMNNKTEEIEFEEIK